jgi:hypothetical protein
LQEDVLENDPIIDIDDVPSTSTAYCGETKDEPHQIGDSACSLESPATVPIVIEYAGNSKGGNDAQEGNKL